MSDVVGTFPLVQRHRVIGLSFAAMRSSRRGLGSDVAGSRPYQPGDDVKKIDWPSSARLSMARGTDEFIVREHFAEEAPRVVVVADRRPSMAYQSRELPWLSKPDALAQATSLVSYSAIAARSFLGYLDDDEWIPPRSQRVLDFPDAAYDAPADALARALRHLGEHRRDVPAGTFVFLLSDFLAPPDRETWLRVLERRWDVVPVVIQDPLWEQTFPDVSGFVVPFVDPERGDVRHVNLTATEAASVRERNEARFEQLVSSLRGYGLEPVLISSAEPREVLSAFLSWADRRLYTRGRKW